MDRVRKLTPETRKRLCEIFCGQSIPALIQILGLLTQHLEHRGVMVKVFLDNEELPL